MPTVYSILVIDQFGSGIAEPYATFLNEEEARDELDLLMINYVNSDSGNQYLLSSEDI